MGNKEIMQMLKLIEEKKAALEAIYDLTLEQKKDIDESEGIKLDELIDKKQVKIDEIVEIDKFFQATFEKLKRDLKITALDELDLKLYPELKTLQNQVKEISESGSKIMELETENRTKLEALIKEIKKDIKNVSVGRKSINAYEKQNINTDGVYIDKKK